MNYQKPRLRLTLLRLSLFIVFVIPLACEQYDDPLDEDWDEELDDRAQAKKSGCEGKCSSSCRCGWTELGCKKDGDCQSGLYCEIRPQLGNRCLKNKNNGGDNNNDNNNNNDNSGNCHEFPRGHGKYCSSSCPCGKGEGDCDKDSECKSGLVCKQQSGTDFCVASSGGGGGGSDVPDNGGGGGGSDVPDSGGAVKSNLQVRLGGKWKGVCCSGGELEVSGGSCKWSESNRVLKTKDLRNGNSTALDCPENGQRPADCRCTSSGERMHGISANGSVHVKNSLKLSNGAPIYPNSGHETCIDLVNGNLQSRWTTNSCPNWRLVNFY